MRAQGDSPEPAHIVLALAVTPHGDLRIDWAAGDADDPPAGVTSRVEAAFARGSGAGVLEALWNDLNAAARRELGEWEGDVESWLQARSPLWHSVGRVCFHLAENKASETKPFAFLAAYAMRLSDAGRVQHLPLGHGVKTSGAARDRDALRSLLVPLQRAAERSPFVKALVDSGEVFRPLA